MSFKRFLNSHFVFENEKHISFFQGSSFRFAVIKYQIKRVYLYNIKLINHGITDKYRKPS